MPELPEVETIRQSLQPCVGARIAAVNVWQPELRLPVNEETLRSVIGQRIDSISRRGKYLIFELCDQRVILVHFGMSGTLRIAHAQSARTAHDHVRIVLSTGQTLLLNDPRRFGLIWAGKPADAKQLAQLGPDALAADFTADHLYRAAKRSSRAVKNVLLDQRVVAGIGNIYANEALFAARIRPGRKAQRLSRVQTNRLHSAVGTILKEAIAAGGSSISDFHDGNGKPGYFQLRFRVYGREGKPCLNCSQPIRRVSIGGRSSFFCPNCQH